jgi:hypothetical protein
VADVFISYKTERRNAAQHVSRILELNGYSVWFDYGLLSGSDFGPQIERELRAAKAVVVLWCSLSFDSRWVLEEAHLAERLGTLTPVRLEPVELPLGFGRANTVDLTIWDGSPRSPTLDRLLNEIGRRVGRDPEPSFRGLQHYEETWRSFGSPPLSQFALVDPITEEERSFAIGPRAEKTDGDGRPVRRASAGGGLAFAQRRRSWRTQVAIGAVAATLILGGAAVWYWKTAQPQITQASPEPTAPPRAQARDNDTPPAPAAPPAPQPATVQPISAPLPSFMRSNSGWTVSLSFIEPVTAIRWRLGDTGAFKDTGLLDTLDPRTRQRMANPSFGLSPNQQAATIQIQAVGPDGYIAGPFPVAFDPAAALDHEGHQLLEATTGSWIAFGEATDGVIVYYTHLVAYRCAIREMRIGIGTEIPNKVMPLSECDPKHPYEIPAAAQTYLRLPAATKMVSVQLIYTDGGTSETKTFSR